MKPPPVTGRMTQAELVRASLVCCPAKATGPYVGAYGKR